MARSVVLALVRLIGVSKTFRSMQGSDYVAVRDFALDIGCENHRFRSRGRLGRLLIGIPIVSDPRHTTGAAKPFLGVALRFKASKGDDAAAWKARLYTPSTPDPSGVEGDLIRKLGHARQYAPCMSR